MFCECFFMRHKTYKWIEILFLQSNSPLVCFDFETINGLFILLKGEIIMKKVMLTGVRPSGNLTIGNYLGAIKNFVDRQDLYESFIFLADLHAITSYIQPEKLKE